MTSAQDWIAAFAREAGVEAPSPAQFEALLELAGEAAHSSERVAAPVACWLAALAGRSPSEALELARSVSARLGSAGGDT